MEKENKTQRTFPRLIAEELHNQWRSYVRSGDSEAIAKALKVSKPTVDKALIYGHAHKKSLINGITKFFIKRLEGERESAKQLESLKQQTS